MSENFDPTKRLFIKGLSAICLLSISRVGFATPLKIIAVRIWPSPTYTRITVESNIAISYRPFQLTSPERLVIDIENTQLNGTWNNIGFLVKPKDPYIKQIRTSQFDAKTVRIVIDLKQSVNPNLFTLKPIANFHHRFVIDLLPKNEISNDPLLSLLEQFNKGELSNEEKSPQPDKKKKEKFIVVLDPGHGGEDPGAIGYYKTKEKDIVLKIAHRLRDLIQKQKNMSAYLTRNEDIFLPLEVRVAKARKLNADIFISIHADAFTKRSAHGASIFTLSSNGASSSIASYLAKTQNKADEIGGVSRTGDNYLDQTFLSLVQNITKKNSSTLANLIFSEMKKISALHKPNVEQAGFAVLKAPDIPSILVETAFISNLSEERKLKTVRYQQQVANALLKGIKNYMKKRIV